MKIIICFPPLSNEKGYPTLGQNRQFQYFKEPTYIYPVVPATAATMLAKRGFDVVWLDCISQNLSSDKFRDIIRKEKPDLVALETKTPVIKQEWRVVDDLKRLAREEGWNLNVVLFGDHVTALPQESFDNCGVDFILTGGDYDFLLLNLCNFLKEFPSLPARDFNGPVMTGPYRLEPGIWYRAGNEIKNTGTFKLDHDLNSLPFIDRDLTRWPLYAYKNGNYRRTPGTYIMSARDCWWGKCTFCGWTTIYPHYRARGVKNVLNEIEYLVNNYKIKEIMDDSGTFPVGEWLNNFCRGMIERGLNKKVTLDCNMRFGAVDRPGYELMRKAGFRFLLFGLESASQQTLDRINKNLKAETIVSSCRAARAAGLYPHITLMFGYPWESYEDAEKTLQLGKYLLKKDYAYTMQATVVIPYPGTPLFDECKKNGLLYTLDWQEYDMKKPVMKLSFAPDKLMSLVQSMYAVTFSPEFIFHKLLSIRDINDIKYFGRGFLKVLGHLLDFRKRS